MRPFALWLLGYCAGVLTAILLLDLTGVIAR